MARKQQNTFLEERIILSPEDIRDTVFNEYNILKALGGEDRGLEWLVRLGLIPNTMNCSVCRELMSLLKRKQKTSLYRWRCINCGILTPITNNTFFHHTKISFKIVILSIYKWLRNWCKFYRTWL